MHKVGRPQGAAETNGDRGRILQTLRMKSGLVGKLGSKQLPLPEGWKLEDMEQFVWVLNERAQVETFSGAILSTSDEFERSGIPVGLDLKKSDVIWTTKRRFFLCVHEGGPSKGLFGQEGLLPPALVEITGPLYEHLNGLFAS